MKCHERIPLVFRSRMLMLVRTRNEELSGFAPTYLPSSVVLKGGWMDIRPSTGHSAFRPGTDESRSMLKVRWRRVEVGFPLSNIPLLPS